MADRGAAWTSWPLALVGVREHRPGPEAQSRGWSAFRTGSESARSAVLPSVVCSRSAVGSPEGPGVIWAGRLFWAGLGGLIVCLGLLLWEAAAEPALPPQVDPASLRSLKDGQR